jgi:hypothetical protein
MYNKKIVLGLRSNEYYCIFRAEFNPASVLILIQVRERDSSCLYRKLMAQCKLNAFEQLVNRDIPLGRSMLVACGMDGRLTEILKSSLYRICSRGMSKGGYNGIFET